MGKSPGKWIKTVLLGRKTSKSNLSKGVKVENNAVPEQPEENLHSGHPVVTETAPYQSRDTSGAEEKSEKGIPGAVSSEVAASLPVQQQPSELNDAVGLSFTNDEDTARLELAAIKAQAAFRGYLARRAFWALKGIIRLQALIRGHLVRRQAVATLHCVHYVVKLQALVRGRMVRISYPGLDLSRKGRVQEIQGTSLLASAGMTTAFRSQKLSTNAFAIKLLSLLPKAMPLSLQYGPDEPNSAWIWLQRWSLLHFWEPFTPPKVTAIDVKSQAKLTAAGDKGKSKRTLKKVASTTTPGENTNSTPFEFEKPKRNPRKLATHHQIESSAAQEQQAQSELEKVKRNLRKVSASSTMATTTSVVAATEKSETENEKSVEIPGKVSNITVAAADVSDSGTTTNLPADQTDKSADDTEMTLKPLKVDEDDDEPVHLMHPDENEQNSSEIETKVVTDNAATTKNEESDQTETENQKIIRRRKSLPVKQEYHENVSQNSASVPSYMAATESAKAKLRLQASIKLSEDGGENGFVRRHSLPNPGNGKFNSISPRVQKPGQVNGKGGIKTNKSLSASRDERVFQPQPGWRR